MCVHVDKSIDVGFIPKPYEFLPLFCDILQYFLLMLMYNCYTLELKAVSQHDYITKQW